MTAIKICGLTRRDDALMAAECGASALGFVLWPGSPRAVDVRTLEQIVRDLPPYVVPVGVFVAPAHDDIARAAEAGIRVVQVHGDADLARLRGPWTIVRAVRLSHEAGAITPEVDEDVTVLVDAYDPVRHGGTGRTVDWSAAAAVARRRRMVLAGGLTPENVREAIDVVRPYAVDVASGVETAPGRKDSVKMRAFIEAVRHP